MRISTKNWKLPPQLKKISWCFYWEKTMITSLHHSFKIENIFFFGFCHLFRGLTPLKFKNFVKKLKTSTTTQIFSWSLYWEKEFIPSPHHTIKIENFNFFGISSLISWANNFKNREFGPKMEYFHHHSKIFHDVYPEKQ